jgi:hypothetical protein
MKIKNPFQRQKSLAELQEEDELKSAELSIARKEALIIELKARGNKWQNFSADGTKKGVNFSKIKAWIKSH